MSTLGNTGYRRVSTVSKACICRLPIIDLSRLRSCLGRAIGDGTARQMHRGALYGNQADIRKTACADCHGNRPRRDAASLVIGVACIGDVALFVWRSASTCIASLRSARTRQAAIVCLWQMCVVQVACGGMSPARLPGKTHPKRSRLAHISDLEPVISPGRSRQSSW